MKLQLVLVQKDIDSYAEVRELTDHQRKQITVELKTYFGNKVALKELFSEGECIFNYWHIVDVESPETVLYDFWELNGDSGGVFPVGTTDESGVEMIQGSFDVQAGWVGREEADALADALSTAERTVPIRKDYKFNHAEEVVEFVSHDFLPKDSKEWVKFLKNLKVNEIIVLQHHAHFNKTCWRLVSEKVSLSEETIMTFAAKLDWDLISQHQRLSEDFIRRHADGLNWKWISFSQQISEPFIKEFQDRVDWDSISSRQKLSESFIREFSDRVSWTAISWAQKLSPDFMRDFRANLKWDALLSYNDLPELLLKEFMPLFDASCWSFLCMRQKLSVEFIDEFAEKINWRGLSHNQTLTPEHLRKYKDNLDWNTIVHFGAGLSESLLREFENYISHNEATRQLNWKTIFKQKSKFPVSEDFKKEILKKIKND